MLYSYFKKNTFLLFVFDVECLLPEMSEINVASDTDQLLQSSKKECIK